MFKIELPAYVNTFFHTLCEDCKYCELEFSEEQYNGNVAYTMTCKHLDLCASVKAKVLAEECEAKERKYR